MTIRRAFGLALALLAIAVAGTAAAQGYPNKAIRVIVPYPPGGGTDVIARILQEPLAAELGQPIIIDNRGGAAGNLGTDLAAKAAADGYTILFTLSSHTINPKLYDKLPFDVERDFAPITLATLVPQILVANPSLPANDMKELIAYAKANPGKLNYASVGTGSPAHIAGELLKLKTGIDMVHVPYKGGGPAVIDTIGGQVQLAFVSMPAAWQHVKAGKLKALGVTSARRAVAAPDVPAIAETVPGYVVDSWYGALAPAKTPPAAIARLNAAFAKALDNPQVKEKLLAQGAEAAPGTPAEFDRRIKDELAQWELVIKSANIRPE
jgi:tripartite-type tricarboxylate transporter receptor subunit TctC